MKRLPWKYTAGLIDGEGCIKFGIKKKTVFEGQGKKEGNKVEVYYPQINLELTLAEPGFHVIEMLHNSYGGYVYHRESKNPNWKDTKCWRIHSKNHLRLVFNNVVKHTYIKKEQIRFAMWCLDNLKGQQPLSVVMALKKEFRAQKDDPHRLSEQAQEAILAVL